jgi:hypothetical protein
MQKFGLYKFINLAGDTAERAKNKKDKPTVRAMLSTTPARFWSIKICFSL